MVDSFLKFTPIEDKLDDVLYDYYCHHWSADYISPHVPTILAMSVVTMFTGHNDDLAVKVAGWLVGHEIEI